MLPNISELQERIILAAVKFASDGRMFRASDVGLRISGKHIALDVIEGTMPSLVSAGYFRQTGDRYVLNPHNATIVELLKEQSTVKTAKKAQLTRVAQVEQMTKITEKVNNDNQTRLLRVSRP